MRLTEAEFRKLGYQAVDMAAKYFVEVPRGPVFQRMHESERQALDRARNRLLKKSE